MTAVTWPLGSPQAAASGWLPVPSPSPSWLPLPLRQLVAVLLLLPRRLPFPNTWRRTCRRFGLHWMYHGVLEPSMLQVRDVAPDVDGVCDCLAPPGVTSAPKHALASMSLRSTLLKVLA